MRAQRASSQPASADLLERAESAATELVEDVVGNRVRTHSGRGRQRRAAALARRKRHGKRGKRGKRAKRRGLTSRAKRTRSTTGTKPSGRGRGLYNRTHVAGKKIGRYNLTHRRGKKIGRYNRRHVLGKRVRASTFPRPGGRGRSLEAFMTEIEPLCVEAAQEVLEEAKGKWIQKAIKKPGQLHRDLGVPQGEKIPVSKLRAAAKRKGKVGQRARMALGLKKMREALAELREARIDVTPHVRRSKTGKVVNVDQHIRHMDLVKQLQDLVDPKTPSAKLVFKTPAGQSNVELRRDVDGRVTAGPGGPELRSATPTAAARTLRSEYGAGAAEPTRGTGRGSSPSRSASGNLRNFGAMTDEKLLDVGRQMVGSRDREGLEGITAEMNRRGLGSPDDRVTAYDKQLVKVKSGATAGQLTAALDAWDDAEADGQIEIATEFADAFSQLDMDTLWKVDEEDLGALQEWAEDNNDSELFDKIDSILGDDEFDIDAVKTMTAKQAMEGVDHFAGSMRANTRKAVEKVLKGMSPDDRRQALRRLADIADTGVEPDALSVVRPKRGSGSANAPDAAPAAGPALQRARDMSAFEVQSEIANATPKKGERLVGQVEGLADSGEYADTEQARMILNQFAGASPANLERLDDASLERLQAVADGFIQRYADAPSGSVEASDLTSESIKIGRLINKIDEIFGSEPRFNIGRRRRRSSAQVARDSFVLYD